VRGRATIIVDGGFCRGTDIVKAIAAGADAVAIGRLYCYGLAAAGAAGVARTLALLAEEVRETLALLGITRLSDLGPSCLAPAHPVGASHIQSAFPLLQTPWDGVY
jgi:glycolate oxidase